MNPIKILSLNTQKNYQPTFKSFMDEVLSKAEYDFLLLQEATEEVLEHVRKHLNYSVLAATDSEGKPSLLSVVYRDTYLLREQVYNRFSLPNTRKHGKKPYSFYGILLGHFKVNDREFSIGTVHLPAGFSTRTRKKSLKKIHEVSQESSSNVVIGGDCNFGIFGEIKYAKSVLGPKLKCITDNLPTTLDSRYTEPVPYLIGMGTRLMAKFGLGVKFKTDQVFASKSLLTEYKTVSSKLLPDRVSDHSPIEIIFS